LPRPWRCQASSTVTAISAAWVPAPRRSGPPPRSRRRRAPPGRRGPGGRPRPATAAPRGAARGWGRRSGGTRSRPTAG
jgi:hypothetical protein